MRAGCYRALPASRDNGLRILGLAEPLHDVAPAHAALARECFVAGADAPREAHVAEANAYFTRLADQALPADDIVERAVLAFEASNSTLRSSELCAELGAGSRELNRRFTRTVGVSPKFFG